MHKPWLKLGGVMAVLVGLTPAARAQPDPPRERLEEQVEDATEPSRPPLRIGLRAHVRYEANDTEPYHRFEIRRARVEADVHPLSWLRAQVDLDAAKAPALRDAFVETHIAPWLELRIGLTKKPFSRIETTSSRRLPLCERGIVNERVIDDNNLEFGGRDIGLLAKGRVGDLRYAAGLFNGSGRATEVDSGKDALLRLRYNPIRTLQLGLSGALKWRNAPGIDWPGNDYWAAGIDARLRAGIVDVVAETLWAQRSPNRQHNLGAIVYGQLRFKPTDDIRVRPILKAEVLDDDMDRGRNL
ncbi:porin, partial [Myxococcota bacterium]